MNKGVQSEKLGTRAKSPQLGGAWRAGAELGWRPPAPSSPSETVLWGLGPTPPCRGSQLQRGSPQRSGFGERGTGRARGRGPRSAQGWDRPHRRDGLHTAASRQERARWARTASKGRAGRGRRGWGSRVRRPLSCGSRGHTRATHTQTHTHIDTHRHTHTVRWRGGQGARRPQRRAHGRTAGSSRGWPCPTAQLAELGFLGIIRNNNNP